MKRPWPLIALLLVLATIFGGYFAMRQHPSPVSGPELEAAAREVDEELARYPIFAIAKENNPTLFEKARSEIAMLLAQSHGRPDAAAEAHLQEIGKRLAGDIVTTASHGSDASVLDWLRKEVTLLTGLAGEDKGQCAKRSLGIPFNASEMSRQSQDVNIEVMKAVAAAYREGKANPVPVPPDDEARSLIAGATKGPASPFSDEELQRFSQLAAQPSDIVCNLTLKFYRNALSMPPADAAKIARYLFAAPHG